jgi:hypothetical protein
MVATCSRCVCIKEKNKLWLLFLGIYDGSNKLVYSIEYRDYDFVFAEYFKGHLYAFHKLHVFIIDMNNFTTGFVDIDEYVEPGNIFEDKYSRICANIGRGHIVIGTKYDRAEPNRSKFIPLDKYYYKHRLRAELINYVSINGMSEKLWWRFHNGIFVRKQFPISSAPNDKCLAGEFHRIRKFLKTPLVCGKYAYGAGNKSLSILNLVTDESKSFPGKSLIAKHKNGIVEGFIKIGKFIQVVVRYWEGFNYTSKIYKFPNTFTSKNRPRNIQQIIYKSDQTWIRLRDRVIAIKNTANIFFGQFAQIQSLGPNKVAAYWHNQLSFLNIDIPDVKCKLE